MSSIAFATYSDLPQLSPGDQAVIVPLALRGISTTPVVWDDTTIDWSEFDAVVVRSTWDYHLRITEFRAWITRVEQSGTPLLNPSAMLRWNMDKIYLQQLAQRDINVIPTVWVRKGDPRSLQTILDETDWQEAVVKPRVSASAHETWRITRPPTERDEKHFTALVASGDMMVQRYMPQIEYGEWSFLFFNGLYSHTVLKRPAPGSIYVQAEKGGRATVIKPDMPLITSASNAVIAAHDLLDEVSTYARVDCLLDGDELVLMELELIEPELFLRAESPGTERFADAIAHKLMGDDPT